MFVVSQCRSLQGRAFVLLLNVYYVQRQRPSSSEPGIGKTVLASVLAGAINLT